MAIVALLLPSLGEAQRCPPTPRGIAVGHLRGFVLDGSPSRAPIEAFLARGADTLQAQMLMVSEEGGIMHCFDFTMPSAAGSYVVVLRQSVFQAEKEVDWKGSGDGQSIFVHFAEPPEYEKPLEEDVSIPADGWNKVASAAFAEARLGDGQRVCLTGTEGASLEAVRRALPLNSTWVDQCCPEGGPRAYLVAFGRPGRLPSGLMWLDVVAGDLPPRGQGEVRSPMRYWLDCDEDGCWLRAASRLMADMIWMCPAGGRSN